MPAGAQVTRPAAGAADTDFTDPAAHGTGFERTRAFADGYEAGSTACYPAPAQEWVVGR